MADVFLKVMRAMDAVFLQHVQDNQDKKVKDQRRQAEAQQKSLKKPAMPNVRVRKPR